MRILILEDMKVRSDEFLRRLAPLKISARVVQTADDCISSLKNETWDWLCLDHDVPSNENVLKVNGYDVAKFLEANPDRMPAAILVHSANPVGWQNIKAALPQAIKAPNLWEYIDDVINKLNL